MSAKWVSAAALDEVPDGDVIGVGVLDREIALCRVAGEIYATDNICTHEYARLCEGFLEGYELECPLHQGKFDVRSGKPTCAPVTEPIRRYPVRIEDGKVFVAID
jgi:naphthalene 1,2-dioxygenase ferredoxin component